MEQNQEKILKTISPTKVIFPVILGLAVAAYMFFTNVDLDTLGAYLAKADLKWISVAFLVLFIRDAGYVWRIRYLTNQELSWRSSTYTILLWEFASAVTPSAVGGTAVAAFILNREGIKFGKSLAYVMLTALLDNSFFILAAPLAILLTQGSVFPKEIAEGLFGRGLEWTFGISYTLITIYTLFFAFGLFFKPHGFKWLIVKVTSWRFMKRFQPGAEEIGDEVIIASQEMKGKDFRYWANAIVSTIFVWTARYFMVNCLLEAFNDNLSFADHWLVFARHIVMWVIMLISPTPGSSGTAEFTFDLFFGEYIGGFGVAVALLWRLYTYYPYLFFGAFVLPRWLRKVLASSPAKA
jgi:glycosyltransferase 2 family protein